MPISSTSRNEKQRRIDSWLLAHREYVERETPTAIARELQRLGFYSEHTALVDIRVGVHRRCLRLDLRPVEAARSAPRRPAKPWDRGPAAP
jgi:hypothetical protein